MARRLALQADRIARDFDAAFWIESLGTYALALDGAKRPCAVRSSNPGHCLFAGLVPAERAARVASALLDQTSFSGWGVRTIAAGTSRYNPMSYHNGSIWPHDNALVAAGCARYGLKREAATVFGAMYDASLCFELHRLPELFCGFHRRAGANPTAYPVSCSPQTWASAAVFLMLQATLGLSIRAAERKVVLDNPSLPGFLSEVTLSGLQVGDGSVDLVLTRHERDVGVNVSRRDGAVTVIVVK
jgi:glycogen debranching enzyme